MKLLNSRPYGTSTILHLLIQGENHLMLSPNTDLYEECKTCKTEGCEDCNYLGLVPHEC